MNELTDYEKRFVAQFFILKGDRIAALKAAGYEAKGKHSTQIAYANKMYNKPRVLAEINKRRAELEEKAIVTREEVLLTLTRIMKGQGKYSAKKSNGEVYEVGIKAKDQIEAAKAISAINGWTAPKLSEVKHSISVEDTLAETFIERSNRILEKGKMKKEASKAIDVDIQEEDDADTESADEE
jgi:phage terminase small subunit